MKNIFTFLLILFTTSLYAQSNKGILRGTILDNKTGETLIGVTVSVTGPSTTGVSTDLDGSFSLSLNPGTYEVKVSYVSYETIVLKQVNIKAGETTLFDNIRLKESETMLAEVVVTAELIRNSESALMTLKRKSPTLMDGISSANFKKIGDSDAASSMKRVPGVSIAGGKYVFVRGLGDRYTKTTLNGMDIPGLDPDRNTLQMDIFPTNVVDNIIVYKSFSAELPADFTGGVIDIATKEFPNEKVGSISFSANYNPDFHFNPNYLTYEGGKTDFLGFDDGTRAIPATTNIPQFAEIIGRPSSEAGLRYRDILGGFSKNLAAMQQRSNMDASFGFTLGNQVKLKKFTLGYNASISYKNTTEFYQGAEFGRYGMNGNKQITELEVREFQKGNYGVNSVFLSGLGGLAIKTSNSKYKLNLLHLQNGESKAGIFDYLNNDLGAIFNGFQHNLEYSQRSLSNILLSGEHVFDLSNWKLQWKVSPTFSSMDDPDVRFTRYEIRGSNLFIGTEAGFPERIWRNLSEYNLASQVNLTKEFDRNGSTSKLKFGAAQTYKDRNYIIRNFALNLRNIPLTGDPNEILREDNLWPRNGNIGQGTTFETPFLPTNPNQFDASTNTVAGYASLESNPFTSLKAILGARLESYTQRYTGQDQLGANVLNNEVVLNDIDLFPSVNLIYSLTDNQNVRLTYGKTIARPSLKELSYAEIYDPITGRTFIGGLFRDANDVAGVEYWDGNLRSTSINNFDIRWESFQENEQMISVSAFYKAFINPIEMIQFATQVGAFQPRNVGNGQVLGLEFELRKGLSVVSPRLKNFAFSTNLTYTRSRIELSQTEFDSRVLNAREGFQIGSFRDMAGQSPYIINAGISYKSTNNASKWNGLEAGVFYNVQGPTLQFVGIVDRPDIYSVPFHSLNFNSNMTVGKTKKWSVGLKIDNILNDANEMVFKSFQAQDQFFQRLLPGRSFSANVRYSLF